jgi:hypothetical protein
MEYVIVEQVVNSYISLRERRMILRSSTRLARFAGRYEIAVNVLCWPTCCLVCMIIRMPFFYEYSQDKTSVRSIVLVF